MFSLLEGVTDVADQAVILPVVAVVAVALAVLGWRRGAAGWTIGVGATLGLVGALKLVCQACNLTVQSPSGHTASAALAVGGLWWVFGRGRPGVLAASLLAAAVIGATRLALNVHTPAEVLIGGLAGIAGAALLPRLTGPPPPGLRLRPVALVVLAAVFSTYGRHLGAEEVIHDFAWAHGCRLR